MKRKLRSLLSAVCFFFILCANANNAPVSLAVSFRADNSNGCSDLEVSFHDETTTTGDPIIKWEWNFGDGQSSTDQHPVHIYKVGGTYDVKLKIETQSGAVGELVKSGIVNVSQKPLAPFGKDTAICEGSSFLLNAGNPGATYLWNNGEVTSSILISEEGEYSVTIDLSGCILKDTVQINIRPDIFPNFGFTPSGACASVPVQFTDSSSTCSGILLSKWKWEFGDGQTSSLQNPSHIFATQDTFSVKLTVWDENGFFISRTKKLIVGTGNLKPKLGADTTICEASKLILRADLAGATYEWSTGESTQQISINSAGEYWVRVTKDGCEGIDTIAVSTLPSLTVDFSHKQLNNCVPATVTFKDSSKSCSDNIVEWHWNFGDGSASAEQHPEHIYSAAGNYFVTLTAKNSDGISIQSVQEIVVSGLANPVVGLPADTSVCDTDMLTLTVQQDDAIYLWSNGETSQSISVEEGGKYSVSVSKDGCQAIDSVQVTFTPQLLPAFVSKRVEDCDNIKVQFSDSTLTCGVSITKWQWDLGDGNVSAEQHPLHVYSLPGTYAVKLKVTDNTGLSLSRSRTITVTSMKPEVNLGNDTAICYNSGFNLSAGNSDAEYMWSTGETTREILVNDEDNYWVEVSKNGCTNTDTIKIGVKFPIIPNFDFVVTSKCLPVKVDFNENSLLSCDEVVTGWLWEFGDGTTSTQSAPGHLFNSADTFMVKLTVTTENGIVISKSKKVVVTNDPVALSVSPDVSICRGETAALDASLTGATYSWTPVTGLTSSTVKNPVASPTSTTSYILTATKCMVTLTDTITIKVDSIAKPQIETKGNTLEAPAAAAYKWFVNGKVLAGKTTKILTPATFGYYSVEVTNGAGCKNISDSIFFVSQGESQKEMAGIRLKVSPNPSPGIVKVILSKIPQVSLPVVIYDSYGNTVYRGKLNNNVNTLNLQKLSKGQYYLQCSDGREKVSITFSIL